MGDVIDVVIVTFNSAHVIGPLLDSLPGALGDLPARIIVVDNGSSDDTREVVEARHDCLLVRSDNVGYAGGINRGVAALHGEGPILVLNPDVRLRGGSVQAMAEALARPGVGVVAPCVHDDQGRLVPALRREPNLLRALGLGRTGRALLSEYVTDPAAYRFAHVVDWALGAVLMVARACHEDVGGWDESFFLYSEETDFCLRARDHGWRTWYEPAAVVDHIGGQSGQSPSIHAMQIVNRVRLYRRRHSAVPSLAYLLLAVASELSWVVRGHRHSVTALIALLSPRRRPIELGCSDSFLPS